MRKKDSQLTEKTKAASFKTICWGISLVASFYAYQYFTRPEIRLLRVDGGVAQHSADSENLQIHLVFVFENVGKSKTNKGVLHTAFVDWTVKDKSLVVSPSDFTESPVFDLSSGQRDTFEIDKYVKAEEFVRLANSAGGLYCVALYRWRGDNLAYLGRTFENNMLLLMRPGVEGAKMTFNVRLVRQIYSTDWFLENRPQDRWARLVSLLSLKEIIYGDRFFD